jgi:hypothetical protein
MVLGLRDEDANSVGSEILDPLPTLVRLEPTTRVGQQADGSGVEEHVSHSRKRLRGDSGSSSMAVMSALSVCLCPSSSPMSSRACKPLAISTARACSSRRWIAIIRTYMGIFMPPLIELLMSPVVVTVGGVTLLAWKWELPW